MSAAVVDDDPLPFLKGLSENGAHSFQEDIASVVERRQTDTVGGGGGTNGRYGQMRLEDAAG